MKIAVCVNDVPVVAQRRFDPITRTMIRRRSGLGTQSVRPSGGLLIPQRAPTRDDSGAACSSQVLPVPAWEGAESTVVAEHRAEHTDAVTLTQAQVVLGIGMGLGGPEALPTIQALAKTLGATLATTRDVVHSRWLPHHLQVGISGRSIAPRLYLAVGIRVRPFSRPPTTASSVLGRPISPHWCKP